jgi:glutamate-1-semialdehyde 2,1-aminomutase
MSIEESMSAYREHPLTSRARKVMTSGNTRATLHIPPAPPYAVSGKGCLVTDNLSHTVIDANNNLTSTIHGHAFEPINEVVRNQLEHGVAFGLPTESAIALAEVMAQRTGIPMWRFSNSGTEALMTAIRGARAFTKRDVIVRFTGSYHGAHEVFIDPSAIGIPAATAEVVVSVAQGSFEEFDHVMSTMGDTVAAVVIDLMPNRAGLIPADQEFVEHIRKVTKANGCQLIVDEVITFRIHVGGMHKVYGIEPDLVTVGKIMGGGFPVGGLGGSAEIMQVFDPEQSKYVALGGTFSANPVTMIAGKVAMDHFEIDEVNRLNSLGDNLREQLTASGVKVNGFGSLARLHGDFDMTKLWWLLYEKGVLVAPTGLIALSTPMTQTHVDQIANVIVSSFSEM